MPMYEYESQGFLLSVPNAHNIRILLQNNQSDEIKKDLIQLNNILKVCITIPNFKSGEYWITGCVKVYVLSLKFSERQSRTESQVYVFVQLPPADIIHILFLLIAILHFVIPQLISAMSLTAEDIFHKIMEKAADDVKPDSGSPKTLQRFHVSQTADQLPDIRQRNAFYRAELERQIKDKREAERKRKERDALEEERLLRKIESDREKLKREYLEEIRQRELLQEETIRRQQVITRKLEEIQEAEERKREEEMRRRQQAAAERIVEIEKAMEKKRLEEIERRKQAYERVYYLDPAKHEYYRGGNWNSRDYVYSALGTSSSTLSRSYWTGSMDDIYYAAPLPVLADVYRRLVHEKTRIKDIMRERIKDGEI